MSFSSSDSFDGTPDDVVDRAPKPTANDVDGATADTTTTPPAEGEGDSNDDECETYFGLCCGGFLCWPCVGKKQASEYGLCWLGLVCKCLGNCEHGSR